MWTLLKAFARNESGATAIEYGLIAALIALVIISSLRQIGTNLISAFNKVGSGLQTATR